VSGALGFMMTSVTNNPVVRVGVSAIESNIHDGTFDLDKPSGTLAGDLMIAFMARANDSDGWAVPSGWTSAVDGQVGMAWKVAGGIEPGSYTFTIAELGGGGGGGGGSAPAIRGGIVSYRHCVFDAAGAIGTATAGAACVAPSVTLADIGLLLGFFADEQELRSFTLPDGMLSVTADFTAGAPSIALFSQQLSAGASGTRSSTPSGGGNSAGVLIALKGVS
jgi:hypothetical protein